MKANLPCDFERIPPGSAIRNPCSPLLEPGFRGLRIAAPDEVRFGPGTRDPFLGGFARVVVAGACQLEYQELGLRGEWNPAIVLVAADRRTLRVYSGAITPFGNPEPRTDPLEGSGLEPSAYEGSIVGTWFNPNLARELNLPAAEADYDVYATLGPYRSNVVTIRVRRLEEESP